MREGTGVLVIGGGPAGLAAAIAARMKGFEVTVADGAKPPIDKACGEGLMPGTMAALRELGVAICPSDGQVFRGIRFVDAATSVEASFPGAGGFGVRRTTLHQKMVERAQECGITLLWNTPVAGFSSDGSILGDTVIKARTRIPVRAETTLSCEGVDRLHGDSLGPNCAGVRHATQQRRDLRRADFTRFADAS